MRALIASTLIAGAAALALIPAAFADSTSSTSGGGASVSIVTGDNGGTTIVVDSNKPCRIAQNDTTRGKPSGTRGSATSNSTTIHTGPGGLSGSTTIGPNGPSVSMQSGSGTTSSSAGSSSNAAGAGECVVVLHGAK